MTKTNTEYLLPTWSEKLGIYRERVRNFWKIYSTSKMGVVGLGLVLSFFIIAVFASLIAPYDPYKFVGSPLLKPTGSYILGTDHLGRDIFSRIIYGARISLLIGLVTAAISVGIGTTIGLTSGYFGGFLDTVLMRVTDMFITMPTLPLMLILASILGKGLINIIIVISILYWTPTARMVRSQTISLKERPFVEASKAVGCSDLRIIGRHIAPNVFPLVFANAIITIVDAILAEAGLSFLGLGDPFQPSWGMVLHYANLAGAVVHGLWWQIIPPGVCIMLLVLGFALVSYSLDQILNPRIRKR